ncbi:hypothetical protein B0H14DRAFT_3457980 [Mycena olivaceomarginata]|nr:hypothetical protein B0H14DRAFT_3457978 [Mycena olivaceomarginata]KAJ7840606.1 hypothetical protein B0H14DRAFT_3457980 [Mycena olivaceomarginata]
MQFKLQISALLLAFAMRVVSAAAVANDSTLVKKDVWNNCFNLGYEGGEASGCNAASGNNGKRGGPVSDGLTCPGGTVLGDAFNEGFNDGFNDGWNRCI